MSDVAIPGEEPPARKSRLPLVVGLVLMLVLGGGGFFAVYSGMVLSPRGADHATAATAEPLPEVAFVAIEPLVVSLDLAGRGRYLHFAAQLEVSKEAEADVTHLLPRIVDVLNGYLRAVDVKELEEATALMRLRAQMLRRVKIVVGEERVRDLLVTEFVIN